MASSLTISFPPLSPDSRRRLLSSSCCFTSIRQWNSCAGLRISRRRRVCFLASISEAEVVTASWVRSDSSNDGYGGWLVGQPEHSSRKAIPRFLIAGIGSSVVILLASLSHFYFARKGFKFQFKAPFHPLSEIFRISEPLKSQTKETEFREDIEIELEDKPVTTPDASDQTKDNIEAGEKRYKIVPVAADSTQQEALFLLQKLKIIETDANPYEFCTRREYARWLVKENSLLERDPKHRIVPSMLIAGSTIHAFDDVNTGDPDFCFIQALGEAGIVPSKLSAMNRPTVDEHDSLHAERYMFYPESFISRIDMISWKAKLEYPLIPVADEKMLRKSVGFMDLGTVDLDALQELFMDTLAGGRSIARRVFGNIRRLQPLKPVTKAQAAVALTSGRMMDAVRNESSRLEAEHLSRMADIKDTRSELIHKGDIQRFWEEKISKERVHGLNVQHDLEAALHNLEEETIIHKKEMADHVKEKAALDCQRQLLLTLKEEIDGMHERLARDKATVAAEQQSLEELSVDLREKQDAIVETKSILEAEKEALRILRSWVEDGARQSQFRAKVLENAVQRWKWDDQVGLPKTSST